MVKCNMSYIIGQIIGGIAILAMLLIILFGAWGWGRNFKRLVNLDFKPPYKAEILRGAGIFPPIGAIMGWIYIEDGDLVNSR